jgi:hypothetical protein
MFPMTIVKKSGRADSRSGGKDFHLILITTADGRALYINRWGKKGQWGNGWSCSHYDDADEARTAFNKKFRDKLQGEYTSHFVDKTKDVFDEVQLRKELGLQTVAAIGGPKWAQLIPGADTSGMKDGQQELEWIEGPDGKMRPKERPRKLVEDVPEPPEPIEDRVATNPNWGIWG